MAPIDFHSRKKITIEVYRRLQLSGYQHPFYKISVFNWRKKRMSDDNVEDERSQVSMTYQMYHVEDPLCGTWRTLHCYRFL